ncbi:MAG: hypothetical protein FJX63_06380 [Alphaproteobacteria bacterium]|nr:hypothetical protein [Alphaproteobacteria bacterium]
MARYPGQVPIDGYGAGLFHFAGMAHHGAILALPSGIYDWSPSEPEPAIADFTQLFAEASAIDIVLLGTGGSLRLRTASLRQAFAERSLSLDAMASPAALSTYNLLLAERRRVAAALLPVRDLR